MVSHSPLVHPILLLSVCVPGCLPSGVVVREQIIR